MQIMTITTAGGVNEIDFGNDDSQSTAHFYWFKNLSDSVLYVSAKPDPLAGKDDVSELPAKGATSIETDEGKVYVLGTGKVEIHRTNSKFCPFEWMSSGSSGGGGSATITVDSELSETSVNPLQNKATTAAINEVKSDLVKTQENVAENAVALSTKSDVNHIHDITASGDPVTLTNLQGGVPFSEIVVSGKNLLKYPYHTTTKTINGVTFTDNGDGTITANGTATAISSFALIWKNFYLPKGTYTISGSPEGGDVDTGFYAVCGTDTARFAADTGNGGTFSIIDDINDFTFSLRISSGVTVDNIVFRPQLELGNTATYYEPPITSQEVTITRCGKNLLKSKSLSFTHNGVTAVINDDGSVTINRTETSEANSYIQLWNNISARSIGTKKITINAVDGQSLESCYTGMDRLENGTYLDRVVTGIKNNGAGTVTQEDINNDRLFRPWIFIHKDYSPNNLTIYPQLELGDAATEYEPYHADTISITPAFNPYTIQNDLLQYDDTNTLIASIGELKVVGVQKNAAIKKIWDKFTSIDNDIVDLYSKISTLEFNTSASIEANGQEIEAVKNTLSRTNDDLTSVTNNVASNTSRIDNLEATINTTLASDIDMLKTENEALHAEIEALRALVETT